MIPRVSDLILQHYCREECKTECVIKNVEEISSFTNPTKDNDSIDLVLL